MSRPMREGTTMELLTGMTGREVVAELLARLDDDALAVLLARTERACLDRPDDAGPAALHAAIVAEQRVRWLARRGRAA